MRTIGEIRHGGSGSWDWSEDRVLLLILAVSAVLRLWGLPWFPLQQDEIYTYFEAKNLFETRFEPGIEARPLYYLLQHGLFFFLPERNPVVLRLLPFLFGIAGIWATWHLAKEVGGRVSAVCAALIGAVAPWHLFASGMARYWSLIYLLACLVYWRLLVARRSGRTRDYALVSALILVGTLTHPTFLFPLAGCLLAVQIHREDGVFRFRPPDSSAVRGLWLPLGIGLAALAGVLLLTGSAGTVRNWEGRGWEATLRLVPAIIQWSNPVIFVAGLLGAGAAVIDPGGRTIRRDGGLVTLAATSSVIVFLVAAAMFTDVYADYAITIVPLLIVSSGVLCSRVHDLGRDGGNLAAAATALILITAMLPSTASHLSDGTRHDFRPSLEAIRELDPDRPVFVHPLVQQRWYAPGLDGRQLETVPERMAGRLSGRGGWLILRIRRYGIPGDGSGRFHRWVSSRCSLRHSHQGVRFDVRLYRVELHWCPPEAGSSGQPVAPATHG